MLSSLFLRALQTGAAERGLKFSLIRGKLQHATSAAYLSSTAAPELPPCDFKPQPYKGIDYDSVMNIRKNKLFPGTLTYYKNPVMITDGYMQWLFDVKGRRYLDMFAGIVTVSVGHCHPKVTKTLHDQIDRLWHTTSIYLHPNVHLYAEKLTAKLPGNLKVCYFVNSGSEANDLVMMMASIHTGSLDIIALRNSYHGMSPCSMGLTNLSTWKHQIPQSYSIHQAMNPDVYRGVWGGADCRDSPCQTLRSCDCQPGNCNAKDRYINELEDVLRFCTPKKVAAFFAESIQGVGGTVQFPKGYLKEAYEIIRSKGGLCVADEVQTGFGRLGSHYWGFEAHDVIPDIVTMAKGMGNGFPMAAVVTTPEIAATMSKALHFNTFGGNPMACAVGSAVIDVIDEEKIQANAADVGTYFLTELDKLRSQYSIVGDVRGKGLMIGVEMVTDQKTNTPLPAEDMNSLFEMTKDMGLLLGKGGFYGNVFRIKPPMCVTKKDVDFAIAVLRRTFDSY